MNSKKCIAIFLMSLFFVQTFGSFLIWIDYNVNTDRYVKSCINKAKPAMHCNGKCQMSKKIKALENDTSKNSSEPIKKLVDDSNTFFEQTIYASIHFFASPSIPKIKNILICYLPFNEGKSLFHPPLV